MTLPIMQAGDVTLPIRVLYLPMAFNEYMHIEISARNNVTLPIMQAGDVTLPIRVLHLPMAFNERWTHGAIEKYMRSVRSEGPYLPSNVDFVAANNGLTGQCRYACMHACVHAICESLHHKI